MGLTSARWAVGVVIAALLCASSVDARALRAELDVGVTDIVAPKGSNEPIARARDQVLADADEVGSSSTDDAAAAVETPKPTSSSDDDDDVLSTGITKGLVRRTAVDGVVFVTWANNHYKDFARFWTMRLKSLGLTNFMVGAMDDELYQYMTEMGVATWHMGSKGIEKDAVKKDFGWGSQNFHKMGRDKIRLIRDFTEVEGISVLISDIDVAWLRDPTPFFKRYPSADILVSTDLLRSEIALDPTLQTPHMVDGEGLEFHVCHAASNIGMMWFRPTRGSQQLTREWVRRIEADDKLWDQNAFNDLKALAGACAYAPDGTGLTDTTFGGRVTMGTLPVSQFSNGHTFYAQRLHTRVGLEPYAVHNTFQFGGTPGKRHRAREANAWLGDEEINYFDGDPELPEKGMFMSYTPRIPSAEAVNLTMFAERSWPEAQDDTFPAIETVDEEIVQRNKELVSFQIKQIKTAAAIAQTLGRTLVLPPILCGLDRVWFPHFGRFPGSAFALPFVCPVDHVINMDLADASKFREWTFYSHPEFPAEMRESVATVEVEASDADDALSRPFPDGTEYCVRGPGTGGDSPDGNSPDGGGGGGRLEAQTCGWLGVERDASIAKRRASVPEGYRRPDDVSSALAGVRTSRILHLDTVVPFMPGGSAHSEEWKKLYDAQARTYPPDVWCCSKAGPLKYEA